MTSKEGKKTAVVGKGRGIWIHKKKIETSNWFQR